MHSNSCLKSPAVPAQAQLVRSSVPRISTIASRHSPCVPAQVCIRPHHNILILVKKYFKCKRGKLVLGQRDWIQAGLVVRGRFLGLAVHAAGLLVPLQRPAAALALPAVNSELYQDTILCGVRVPAGVGEGVAGGQILLPAGPAGGGLHHSATQLMEDYSDYLGALWVENTLGPDTLVVTATLPVRAGLVWWTGGLPVG